MKRSLLMTASLAGLLSLIGTRAQADPIGSPTPQWTYSSSFTPPSEPATTTGTPSGTGNGSVVFTGASNLGVNGSSNIVLADVSLNTTSTAPNSALLVGGSAPWHGTLTLTDVASGNSTSINVNGSLTGNNGTPGSFSTVNSNLINPSPLTLSVPSTSSGWSTIKSGGQIVDYVWTAPKSGNTYTIPVSSLSFTPPGPPSQSSGPGGSTNNLSGAISALVEFNAGSGTTTGSTTTGGTTTGGTTTGSTTTGGGTTGGATGGTTGGTSGTSTTGGSTAGGISSAPEPSTLALSCLGLTFAGLASWRKRRRGQATQAA
jgi:hypothetical protein